MSFDGLKTENGLAEGLQALRDFHGADAGRDRILILDDDPMIRSVVKAMVGRVLPGFDVITFPHPVAALQHLEEDGVAGRVAKVFTDNSMGSHHMGGIDFARVLRGETTGAMSAHVVYSLMPAPITLVTGDSLLDEARFLVDMGVLDGIVQKPFTLADISGGVVKGVQRRMRRVVTR